MTKRVYQGKYPGRVNSTFTAKGVDGKQMFVVEVNSGVQYKVVSAGMARMPKLGEEFADYCLEYGVTSELR